MAQALPQSTSHQNVRVVRMEPHVKSAETRKLFNAGVSAKSKTGKTTDPTCYDAPVRSKQESNMLNEHGSETVQVLRDGRTLIGATDLIYSPDDGGYYFSQAEFQKKRSRLSVGVFKTETAAKAAWSNKTVKWEPWH